MVGLAPISMKYAWMRQELYEDLSIGQVLERYWSDVQELAWNHISAQPNCGLDLTLNELYDIDRDLWIGIYSGWYGHDWQYIYVGPYWEAVQSTIDEVVKELKR